MRRLTQRLHARLCCGLARLSATIRAWGCSLICCTRSFKALGLVRGLVRELLRPLTAAGPFGETDLRQRMRAQHGRWVWMLQKQRAPERPTVPRHTVSAAHMVIRRKA